MQRERVSVRESGWGGKEVLRVYEALNRDVELDLEGLSSEIGPLPASELARLMRSWEREPGHERAWLFGVLGRIIQAACTSTAPAI